MFKHIIPFVVNWCFPLPVWQVVLGTQSRKRPWTGDERDSRDLKLLKMLEEEAAKSNPQTNCSMSKTNMHCWDVLLCFSVPVKKNKTRRIVCIIQGWGRSRITKSQQSIRKYEKQKEEWEDQACQKDKPSSSSSWAVTGEWATLGLCFIRSWRKISAEGKYIGQWVLFYPFR